MTCIDTIKKNKKTPARINKWINQRGDIHSGIFHLQLDDTVKTLSPGKQSRIHFEMMSMIPTERL